LPQLWNVLRGEMSLVGPRPLVPAENDQVMGWHRTRLDLTPGLTGQWQVMGRNAIPFQEMVKLDYLYVTDWSLWSDIKLLVRTLPVVVGRRGASPRSARRAGNVARGRGAGRPHRPDDRPARPGADAAPANGPGRAPRRRG